MYAQDAIKEYTECKTVDAKFVHFADAIQCHQYSRHEMQLGNKGYMEEVFKNSGVRIAELSEKLEQYSWNREK